MAIFKRFWSNLIYLLHYLLRPRRQMKKRLANYLFVPQKDLESCNLAKLLRIILSKVASRHFLIILVFFEFLTFSPKIWPKSLKNGQILGENVDIFHEKILQQGGWNQPPQMPLTVKNGQILGENVQNSKNTKINKKCRDAILDNIILHNLAKFQLSRSFWTWVISIFVKY